MADSLSAAADNDWQSGVAALRQGQVAEAVQLLSAFVQSNPDSFEGHNFLGVALAQSKRPAEAITHLQQALRLNSQSAQAHHNLGLVYLGGAQTDNARESFQKALQLDPNHAAARQALTTLPDATAPSPQGMSTASTTPMTSVAPTSTPVAANLNADSPWGINTANEPALATTATVLPSTQLNALDLLKAFAFGSVAAVVGAIIWDKIVYYTRYEIGLVAIAVGFCVGMAVARGANYKEGTSLKVMGALLACFGMLLGQTLIIFDMGRDQLAQSNIYAPWLSVMRISISLLPEVLKESPLTFVFIAIGIYEGWTIPGKKLENPPAPETAQTQDTSDPGSTATGTGQQS